MSSCLDGHQNLILLEKSFFLPALLAYGASKKKASGKYEKLRSRQQRKNSLTPRPLVVVVRRSRNVLSPFTCLEVRPALRGEKRKMLMLFCFTLNISSPKGSGLHSEVVLYRGNPWLGRGKPLFHSPVPKISLIYELLNEQRIRY